MRAKFHFPFQKLASVFLIFEILFAMLFAYVQWYPTSEVGSQHILLHCLGRHEVFFKFDYFVEGGLIVKRLIFFSFLGQAGTKSLILLTGKETLLFEFGGIQKLRRQKGVGGWLVKCLRK